MIHRLSCLALLIICSVLFSAGTLVFYIHHYSSTSSPLGFHCWHEINSSQPFGVEKICLKNTTN